LQHPLETDSVTLKMVTAHSSKIKSLHGSENQKNSPLIIVLYLFQLNFKKV